MDDPLVLFTGLPKAGTTTRVAALRAALSHDHGFTAYEADKDGKPVASGQRLNELELLDIMARGDETELTLSGPVGPYPPFRLTLETGAYKDQCEVWEQSLPDATRVIERSDYPIDGIVISLPIQSLPADDRERLLDPLLRVLRRRWMTGRPVPWVFLDLTWYETLFSRIVPEMLPEIQTRDGVVSSTPLWLAARREVQELAIRSFCQGWIGDNELTQLASTERQRCAGNHPRQMMIQVSSAWGFLAGASGPMGRVPANCGLAEGDAAGGCRPHVPRFTPTERGALRSLKRGHPAMSTADGENVAGRVESQAKAFFRIWKPLGIIEPVPSVVWKRPAPNMFWMPDVMSSIPAHG